MTVAAQEHHRIWRLRLARNYEGHKREWKSNENILKVKDSGGDIDKVKVRDRDQEERKYRLTTSPPKRWKSCHGDRRSHNQKKLNKELDQEIVLYITEVLPFPLDHKLFMTGIMPNGQTMNLVVAEPNNYLYFSLKR